MSRSYWLSPAEFERLVEKALGDLPPRFAKLVENVAIVVEDEPSDDDLEGFDDDDDADDDAELLGIYRGTALTERSVTAAPLLPDEIAIFRGPICRVTESREEAIHEVRETVIHELGHYFGLGDDELP
jgi:predicted Zn-dependent protease with MMP-like domain